MLAFLLEHVFYIVLGILGGTLTGSLGCLVWLLLSRGAAKFTVKYEMVYLRIVLLCFLMPMVLSILAGVFTDELQEDVEIWFNVPMMKGLLLLVLVWFISVIGVLAYRYRDYTARRYVCFENDPIKDEDVLAMVEQWKEVLGIKKKITLYYNKELTSPGIIYHRGYQILLPEYSMTEQQINIALLHELMHLKHGDIVTKNIGFVVNALFPFHPGTYYLQKQIGKWVELSCDWDCCHVDPKNVGAPKKVDRREYFNTIVTLKEKSLQNKKVDVVCCLFENDEMLNLRVDMMLGRKDAKPHVRGVVVAAMVLFFFMLTSVGTSLKGIRFWRNGTITSYVEDTDKDQFRGIDSGTIFAGGTVGYFDENIVNLMDSTDFELAVNEVRVYDISDQDTGRIVVNITCGSGEYQFGCIGEREQVQYMENSGSIITPLEMQEGKIEKFFIRNIGDSACQIELFLKSD